MAFRIGIISDTHGLLRQEALLRLSGVDHIIHGGDIGRPEIVTELREIAPVTAIRGNVDTGDWAREFPETARLRLAERSIFVLHDLKTLEFDPVAAGIDLIVSGHSHVPKIDMVDGVLYLNPGSAGPRRFKLPITLATLEVTPHALHPIIHDLVDRRSGGGHSGQLSPIESSTSATAPAAACGETPDGRSSRAMSKARSRASGSARSCIQPCSSHSLIAPASCSTEMAHPRKVRVAGRFALVISIVKAPA